MTRVRCLFRQCLFNEGRTCTANEIELDRDGVCLTVEESNDIGLPAELDEDSDFDEWDEDDEWDEVVE